MSLLVWDSFLCWKLRIAILALTIYIASTAILAMIMEILDIAAYADDNFEISGGFDSHWRSHVWEGWLACNITMVVAHLAILVYTGFMVPAVRCYPTTVELKITKGYAVLFVCYILVELGTSIYKYSWYGPNTWRRGYLAFSCIFWIMRTILNIIGVLLINSQIASINYELNYGIKRSMDPAEVAWLLRSGTNTPGMMTPPPF